MAKVLLAYLALACVAVGLNTVGGLESYPPFVTSDEIVSGIEARELIKLDEPLSWFEPWNVASGHEHITEVPLRAAQVLFGATVGGGRMAHALIGAVAVVALFGFARHLTGNFTAFIAAMLLAVSHVHVFLSRTFITSIQATAAFALLLWVLTGLRKPQPRWRWITRATVAGVVLGWGVQTYRLAYAFPPLAVATLFAWRRNLPTSWVKLSAIMLLCSAPFVMQLVAWASNNDNPFNYVVDLSPIGPRGSLTTVVERLSNMVTIWWSGRDSGDCYGAKMPVLDTVTGAAFAFGLARMATERKSEVTRLAVIWLPVTLLMGAGLVMTSVSYHRLSITLVLVCLISAWGMAGLFRRLMPAPAARFACLATVLAVAYLNLSYLFVTFPKEIESMGQDAPLKLVARVCRGEGSEADHQLLRGSDSSLLRTLMKLQCPDQYEAVRVRDEWS